jgi:hypothetical protein
MILLLALLLALPILGLIAVFAVPLIGALAVLAGPALVVLGAIALPALAIAGLAGAFSSVNVSAPVMATLEGLGIAIGVFGLIAALAYVANRLATRTPEEALRPQEVPVAAREQVIVEPRRQAAVSMTEETLPADLAAQCQGLELVPCPV